MKPAAVGYMAVAIIASLVHLAAQAESDFDYALSLTTSYSEASQSVRILDKYASFRTGGGGLRGRRAALRLLDLALAGQPIRRACARLLGERDSGAAGKPLRLRRGGRAGHPDADRQRGGWPRV